MTTVTIKNPDLALAGNAASVALDELVSGRMQPATGLAIGMNAAVIVKAVAVDTGARLSNRRGEQATY